MTTVIPAISITNPTPPRPLDAVHNTYRLLYRGALSLPDSHLLLDGLTFTTRLDSPIKNNQLLQNPLALALESMRGRPSMRFMGIINMRDENLWWDESGGVEMDIHPRAILTRIYFENTFCLIPFASTSKVVALPSPNTSATSDVGIRVALGDSDGPETTQIVIFARLGDLSDNGPNSRSLNLVVGRLTARPPLAQSSTLRLPRPDDPTPRKPPTFYGDGGDSMNGTKSGLKRITSIAQRGAGLKRIASSSLGAKRKMIAGVDDTIVTGLGSGVRLGDGRGVAGGIGLFKIPELPVVGNPNTKGKGKRERDVFGIAGGGMHPLSKHGSKGKRKHGVDQEDADDEFVELERVNKDTIKRCTLDHLCKTKDPTAVMIDKTHPEFKELFGWISRGVGYALRAHMKVRPVDSNLVTQLVRTHTEMYIGGSASTPVG